MISCRLMFVGKLLDFWQYFAISYFLLLLTRKNESFLSEPQLSIAQRAKNTFSKFYSYSLLLTSVPYVWIVVIKELWKNHILRRLVVWHNPSLWKLFQVKIIFPKFRPPLKFNLCFIRKEPCCWETVTLIRKPRLNSCGVFSKEFIQKCKIDFSYFAVENLSAEIFVT